MILSPKIYLNSACRPKLPFFQVYFHKIPCFEAGDVTKTVWGCKFAAPYAWKPASETQADLGGRQLGVLLRSGPGGFGGVKLDVSQNEHLLWAKHLWGGTSRGHVWYIQKGLQQGFSDM